MLTSCGKAKSASSSNRKGSAKSNVSGIQQGNKIILSWTMPARNASDGSILNIQRIDIYRLTEPLDAPLSLSEEDFTSGSTLIATLPVKDSDFALKKLSL